MNMPPKPIFFPFWNSEAHRRCQFYQACRVPNLIMSAFQNHIVRILQVKGMA